MHKVLYFPDVYINLYVYAYIITTLYMNTYCVLKSMHDTQNFILLTHLFTKLMYINDYT